MPRGGSSLNLRLSLNPAKTKMPSQVRSRRRLRRRVTRGARRATRLQTKLPPRRRRSQTLPSLRHPPAKAAKLTRHRRHRTPGTHENRGRHQRRRCRGCRARECRRFTPRSRRSFSSSTLRRRPRRGRLTRGLSRGTATGRRLDTGMETIWSPPQRESHHLTTCRVQTTTQQRIRLARPRESEERRGYARERGCA